MAHSARYRAASHVTRPVVPCAMMAVLSLSVTASPEGYTERAGEFIQAGCGSEFPGCIHWGRGSKYHLLKEARASRRNG